MVNFVALYVILVCVRAGVNKIDFSSLNFAMAIQALALGPTQVCHF